MPASWLTVLSVSWRSAEWLRDLFTNMLALADQPDGLRLVVADNTNGADAALQNLAFPHLEIVPVDVGGQIMSMAHAHGLNTLWERVETPFVLVVDPDVALLQPAWDSALREIFAAQDVVAIGAPYPAWKAGKYHDFPSPIFACWRSDALRALAPDWRPYGRTAHRRLLDFALRQTFWLPRAFDRFVLRLPRRQYRVTRLVEQGVGVVSKDTGWEIAQRARQRGWRAALFDVVQDPAALDGVTAETLPHYRRLADEFELYAWQNRPFLTHRNPTLTRLDFNLWTNRNILIYQNRDDQAAKTALWRELVAAVRPASSDRCR